jgi:hypothetical protein
MNLTAGGTITSPYTVAAALAAMEKDRVLYNLEDHTIREPRTVSFFRQLPVESGTSQGVLRGGFKLVYGDRNTDGTAKSGNIIIDVSIRVPQDQDVALAKVAIEMAAGILRDEGITDVLVEDGNIPRGA